MYNPIETPEQAEARLDPKNRVVRKMPWLRILSTTMVLIIFLLFIAEMIK